MKVLKGLFALLVTSTLLVTFASTASATSHGRQCHHNATLAACMKCAAVAGFGPNDSYPWCTRMMAQRAEKRRLKRQSQ